MKKTILLIALMLGSIGYGVLFATPVMAQNNVVKEQLCNSGQQLDPGACGDAGAALFSANGLVGSIVSTLSILIGVIAVIVIIIAGFRFVVSGGDSQAVASARNQILYAVVGIIVAFSAYAIVNFVLTEV